MLVDTHCHLDNPRLAGWVPPTEMIVITNGTGWKSSETAVTIANKYLQVWACVGLAYEKGFRIDGAAARLRRLADHPKVVGIGECGLNYRADTDEATKNYQKQLFEAHIRVAKQLDLPITVHNRNADEDIVALLDAAGCRKVVMHCFTRGREMMKKCIDRKWYMSFGGLITYENNSRMRTVAREIPEELLLLETDAPYSLPTGAKDQVNSPVNVRIIAEKLAEIRQTSIEEIEALTTRNAFRLFKKITVL